MNDFDQKRADRDTVLYNTDGRLFDVVEANGVMEIVARPGATVLWMWTTIASVAVGYFLLYWLPIGSFLTWQKVLLLLAVCWIIESVASRSVKRRERRHGSLEPKRWIFDPNSGEVRADSQIIARIDEVAAVRANRTLRRFRVALQLRDGRQIRLGLWKFAHREWAWRQDAAQIAAFLGVPLEIPPV